MNNVKKSVSVAVGAAFVAAMSAAPVVNAETNPFAMQSLDSGYMQLAEGKCGEGKCGEGKKTTKMEGKCGEGKKESSMEGKCGEGKKADRMEGKCGESKKATRMEGKCGEGKCGGK